MEAHAAFDPFWRSQGITRRQGYRWLADQLGIHYRQCHMALFDVEQCRRVVAVIGSGTESASAKRAGERAGAQRQPTDSNTVIASPRAQDDTTP
jgi:hypothetical protein